MANCCICNREVNAEKASILTLGAMGAPKYLCEECEAEFEKANLSRDVEEIGRAMESIGNKMATNNAVGKLVFNTVNEIFEKAGKRASEIKNGTYDFSDDKPVEITEEEEEIPEELRESKEDIEREEKEQVRNEKIDKILTIVCAVALGAVAVWLIYKIISGMF